MNNIYVTEYKGENQFKGKSHFVIVIAASNSEIAKTYIKEKIGIDVEPTWLMNASYPTIYIQDGSKPADIQAKILYNGNFHVFNK
jgi:predicted mannosyl-3-phosphoglycerate phosphatase (HAD superfamily)